MFMELTFIDYIVLVLLGLFVISRFFGHKLPTDMKHPVKKQKKAHILDFPKPPVASPKKVKSTPQKDASNLEGIDLIAATDPTFNEKEFLNGTKSAYEFYYASWNKKDDEALENLVSPKMLDNIVDTFNKLDEKDQHPKVEIQSLEAEVVDARLSGRTAIVDVKFTAKQSENKVTSAGKSVGKKVAAKIVKSIWTFARPVDSDDPNWELEQITKPS